MDKERKELKVDIAELNSVFEVKRANFSIESSNTKPYDISLMTGNNQTDNKRGNEE